MTKDYVGRHRAPEPPRRRRPYAGLVASAYLVVAALLVGVGGTAVMVS